jgi:hypothetical protein
LQSMLSMTLSGPNEPAVGLMGRGIGIGILAW